MSKKTISIISGLLMLILLSSLVFIGCASSSPAPNPKSSPAPSTPPTSKVSTTSSPIVINSIWAAVTTAPDYPLLEEYTRRLNDRAKGELVLKHKGGGEIMPYEEMAEAVKKGLYDHTFISSGLVSRLVPEANANSISYVMSLKDYRGSGFFDLMQKAYLEKGGLYFIAHLAHNFDFVMGLCKIKVTKLSDLKGKTIMSTPFFKAFIESVGGTPVNVAREEAFDAMQRGMVDAYCKPLGAIWDEKYYESTKFVIDHAYFSGGPGTSVMNPDAWKKLPPHLQKMMTDIAIEMEEYSSKYNAQHRTEVYENLKKKGVEFIKFSPEEAKAYITSGYEAQWSDVLKRSKDFGPKLKEITDKYWKK